MNHDIVLVSNASMNLFPNNKPGDFRVRLPQPVNLDPSYRVALTRISFTKSFFNYTVDKEKGYCEMILYGTNTPYVPDDASKLVCKTRFRLKSGYYTPATFVAMINVCLKELSINGTDNWESFPTYYLENGYLSVKPGIFLNANEHKIKYEVSFDDHTKKYLGIGKDRPVFMNQGLTDLFVYSDLVYPTIVGDTTSELLTILDGQTEKEFGTHCSEVFEDPWYHTLAKTSFQEIRVYIRTDTGKMPHFRFGRVNLRLSFKHEDDIR